MDKRPYTPPTIVRVKLEHQQAVLVQCSTFATSLSTSSASFRCHPLGGPSGLDCRKHSTARNRDSNATS